MKPSLSQIQARLAAAEELREESLLTVRHLALGRMEADRATRLESVSKFDAFEHEYWLLVKLERELISNGAVTMPLETRFNGGVLNSAVITSENAPGASSAIRGASRGPLSEAPQSHLSPGGPPPANLPPEQGCHPANTMLVEELRHAYAAGDVF